jgi:hypothetical protein
MWPTVRFYPNMCLEELRKKQETSTKTATSRLSFETKNSHTCRRSVSHSLATSDAAGAWPNLWQSPNSHLHFVTGGSEWHALGSNTVESVRHSDGITEIMENGGGGGRSSSNSNNNHSGSTKNSCHIPC